MNATLVAAVMAEIPSLFLSEGLLDLLPAALREPLRRDGRSAFSTSLPGILLRLALNETGWLPWARADLFRAATARIRADLAAWAPRDRPTDADLVHAIDHVRTSLGAYLDIVSWGMIHAYVFFHLTVELLARWAPDLDASATVSELTMGLDGIQTFEAHDEIVACAALAHADRGLREAMMRDPAAVATACLAGGGSAFATALRSLLDRHGHRFVARDLSQPTWREQPGMVVEMVRKLIDSDARPSSASRRARRRDAVARTLDRVGAGVGGTVKRLAFERVLRWCEQYYVLRENMRYHADLFLAALRFLALVAAERLVEAGALSSRSDVFFLEVEELRGQLSGRGVEPAALAIRAADRRQAQANAAAVDPPECLVGDLDGDAPSPRPVEVRASRADAEEMLSGIGVSPGVVTARVRVVRSVEELQAIEPGEIVVATATDPSWTSMLAVAGALVLEMGGPLSHGAIVARELSIPAVVNVADATRALVTGELVVVDGSGGTIRRA
ncbi:hypothetical protein K2Z84_20570 [Candidatus Binatia bacterium]|nr:hypothetical protein [Candidatus Binatia bacterium]